MVGVADLVTSLRWAAAEEDENVFDNATEAKKPPDRRDIVQERSVTSAAAVCVLW
jgi:hypothetical protein